jgi:DNA-binding transcriptional LysR family regulator
MDRFEEMRAFVRVAERASFTKAAEDLGVPRATMTNLIKRMEHRLGARLLERTTRQVRLTQDGEAHYHRCVHLIADVDEAEGAFRDARPQGLLNVSMQGGLASHFVLPALPLFLSRYPELRLRISQDDRFVDLLREGVDCVLRAGYLQDSSLAGRQVAALPQVTLASPDYVARFGRPRSLDDLARHYAVDYISSATGRPMALEFQVRGQTLERVLPSTLSVTGTDVYYSAGLAGAGLIQVPRYRVERELAEGRLVELLPELPPPPMPVSVLYLQNRQTSARVRLFVQWLVALFERVAASSAA